MRIWLVLLVFAAGSLAADTKSATLRGKLTQHMGKPAIETAARKTVYLEGDEAAAGVVRDKRLQGADFEAKGRFTAPDRFRIDPIHTRPMAVYKDGKPRLVTFWCDVCSIRTWTPGVCWCCQEETELDLREAGDIPEAP